MKTTSKRASICLFWFTFCISLVHSLLSPQHRISSSTRTSSSLLKLQKGWFASDYPEGDEDENDLVTREAFQRDLLQDPKVKRRRKNGRYKPMDNRDNLPFAVKKITPDPYTHPQIKKDKRKAAKTKKSDLDRSLTSSRLFTESDKGTSTLLGEFKLDKGTTSGDVIIIGDKEFQVQTARCQYKYAGGKRFVMVRKILEVKEVTRVAKEEFLLEQYKKSPDNGQLSSDLDNEQTEVLPVAPSSLLLRRETPPTSYRFDSCLAFYVELFIPLVAKTLGRTFSTKLKANHDAKFSKFSSTVETCASPYAWPSLVETIRVQS
eukprot:scaffold3375_cov153-Cylindrotheca_fusiformis.AAC.5